MRSELPTESRIAELRRSGIVPYSPLATALICGSVLLIFAAFFGDQLPLGTDIWRMADGPAVLRDSELRAVLRESLNGILLLIFGVLAVGLLIALIQTRFLLRKTARSPREPRPRGISLAVLSGAGYVLFALWCIPFGLSLFRNRFPEIGGSLHDLFKMAVTALGICALFGAFVALVWARVQFRRQHRMTREEIRRESMGGD
jgi:flagellar biosynthesis protein FlhB